MYTHIATHGNWGLVLPGLIMRYLGAAEISRGALLSTALQVNLTWSEARGANSENKSVIGNRYR